MSEKKYTEEEVLAVVKTALDNLEAKKSPVLPFGVDRRPVESKEQISAEMARRSSKPRIGLHKVPEVIAGVIAGDPMEDLVDEFGVTEGNIKAAAFGRTYSRHYLQSLADAVEISLDIESREELARLVGTTFREWMKTR